jgi:signal transduction histidine kinase/CheY-like chemotaxis protein
VLVTAAVLPLAVASAIGLLLLARQPRQAAQRGALDTMRALMTAVDLELDRAVTALESLAVSRALERDDLAVFYEEARQLHARRAFWGTVILAAPDGRQLLNVRRPFGAPLPVTVEMDSFLRVVDTRAPAVGTLTRGPVVDEIGFPVRVPIVRGPQVRYVLTAGIHPRAMLQVIERQGVPPEWVISILDARGIHVARSRRHEEYLGKPPAETLQALIRRAGREGWDRTVTLEGQSVYAAFSHSARSGWTVAVGIPAEVVDSAVRRSTVLLGAGVVLSLALALGAAALIARSITRPIGHLRTAAHAVGRGEPPVMPPIPIAEVADVAEALVAAAEARRQAEAEREHLLLRERQARTLAEEASRAKDEFLAMLGHELRNPLAAIATAERLLTDPRGSEETAIRARAVIGRQVDHLRRLVDDLLDVGRVVTGKIVLERTAVDLAGIVEHAVGSLAASGASRAHHVVTALAPAWVNGDSTRLEQIATNLVGNAVKYTPAGGTIHVSVGREGAEAVLRVADDGIGMAPDLVPRVFDLFVQGARGLDRAQGGLGIGLTLVRRLADLHGGTATVESPGEGCGSTFTVRLPAIEAPAPPAAHDAGAVAPPRRRILVVEDNDDARDMLATLLRVEGHEVFEAADGETGLETIRTLRPDIAFIDAGLPGLDGFEVARRVRAMSGARPVLIALTGYALDDDRRKAHEAGFAFHVAKPMDPETLRELIRRA